MVIKWRCTLCGECCKKYVPLIIPEDVQRIREKLNLPLSSFVTFYRPSDFEEPLDESDERLFQTRHGKLALGLSRVDQPDGQVTCAFLKNNVCSIHPFKPYICRQYPFEPQDHDNPDGPFKLMDNPCFGNHALDEVVDDAPVRRNYKVYQQKQDEYVELVREWNSRPEAKEADIENFLSFVGLQWS